MYRLGDPTLNYRVYNINKIINSESLQQNIHNRKIISYVLNKFEKYDSNLFDKQKMSTAFYSSLIWGQFHNLLNNMEIYFPEYYNIAYQRFLALFGHQDLSNYAINDVNNNISLRMESLKLFFNNPFFGIGLENERTIIGTQAHSGLISILIGTGIIGFIFFYFFIFYILFLSFKYEYDDVIIISIIYVFFSLINPVHNNSPAVIVLFLASSLFILKRKKILT